MVVLIGPMPVQWIGKADSFPRWPGGTGPKHWQTVRVVPCGRYQFRYQFEAKSHQLGPTGARQSPMNPGDQPVIASSNPTRRTYGTSSDGVGDTGPGVTVTWLIAGYGRVLVVAARASTVAASAIATIRATTVTVR